MSLSIIHSVWHCLQYVTIPGCISARNPQSKYKAHILCHSGLVVCCGDSWPISFVLPYWLMPFRFLVKNNAHQRDSSDPFSRPKDTTVGCIACVEAENKYFESCVHAWYIVASCLHHSTSPTYRHTDGTDLSTYRPTNQPIRPIDQRSTDQSFDRSTVRQTDGRPLHLTAACGNGLHISHR